MNTKNLAIQQYGNIDGIQSTGNFLFIISLYIIIIICSRNSRIRKSWSQDSRDFSIEDTFPNVFIPNSSKNENGVYDNAK